MLPDRRQVDDLDVTKIRGLPTSLPNDSPHPAASRTTKPIPDSDRFELLYCRSSRRLRPVVELRTPQAYPDRAYEDLPGPNIFAHPHTKR